MPYIMEVRGTRVFKAYVSENMTIVDIMLGFLAEPCLRLYGLELRPASDESVTVGGDVIRGVLVEYTSNKMTEDYVATVLDVCARYSLGVRPTKRKVGEGSEALYQLKASEAGELVEEGRYGDTGGAPEEG